MDHLYQTGCSFSALITALMNFSAACSEILIHLDLPGCIFRMCPVPWRLVLARRVPPRLRTVRPGAGGRRLASR